MLQRVEVLHFVDEEVAIPPVHPFRPRPIGAQCLDRVSEQIVEVDHTAAALEPLVGGCEVGETGRRQRGTSTRDADGALITIGGDHARLRPVEVGERTVRLDLQLELARHLSSQAQPVVGHVRRSVIGCQRAVAQQAQRDAVKRAGLDGLADVEPAQATLQLGRGLAGERERQHVLWSGCAMGRPVRDAPSEHRGLARPGCGHDGEWARQGGDGRTLFCIETVQHRVGRHGRHDRGWVSRDCPLAQGASATVRSCRTRRRT